ncbi:flagellar motor protein MotB [Desulfosarcina sp.]|uniref:flagellar motor protein MotB n=1 Tax=Desulfosarcina sp. TaxID=2027861 RepID=UPI0029BA79A7|nr:flagellar motor protein MotB [Desulfosarcina sp.]MDX2452586.1 flagellar motor protein MotB [Desulfosarcina sp.]MDX2490356.1 flagellar motor protein MotB [Desulfosarcina sp.]
MSSDVQQCPPCDKGAPRWVTTFGDLMSLLLCFFVLLLSFSEIDRQKYKQVAGSMEKAFGMQRKRNVADSPRHGLKMIAKDFDQEAIATRVKEFIGKELEENFDALYRKIEDDIEIEAKKDQLVIRMMGESTFDSGKAEIKTELKPLILRIGQILTSETAGDIIIAGHTDNVPVTGGPFQSNLKLSIARAATVAQFLLDQTSIDPKRISTMGFGEFRPIADNTTELGRRKNRRVEIIVGTMPRRQGMATYENNPQP